MQMWNHHPYILVFLAQKVLCKLKKRNLDTKPASKTLHLYWGNGGVELGGVTYIDLDNPIKKCPEVCLRLL